MIVVLSDGRVLEGDELAHVGMALARYMPWARDQGFNPPAVLLRAAADATGSARVRQGTTSLDGSAPTVDSDAVMVTEPEPLLVNKAEAARLLGVSVRQFERLVAAGEFEAVRIGAAGVRFRRSDLAERVQRKETA